MYQLRSQSSQNRHTQGKAFEKCAYFSKFQSGPCVAVSVPQVWPQTPTDPVASAEAGQFPRPNLQASQGQDSLRVRPSVHPCPSSAQANGQPHGELFFFLNWGIGRGWCSSLSSSFSLNRRRAQSPRSQDWGFLRGPASSPATGDFQQDESRMIFCFFPRSILFPFYTSPIT